MKREALLVSIAAATLATLGGYALSVQFGAAHVEYGWLVFGPTGRVRALVSVTGCTARDTITIQAFVDEKPIEQKVEFKNTGEPLAIRLGDPDGATSYLITKAGTPLPHPKRGEPAELIVNVEIDGPAKYRQYSDLVAMTRDPKTAPVSHFHGPLTIGPEATRGSARSDQALRRGEENDLRAYVSTMDAARGCWVVVKTHQNLKECLFPEGVRPFAHIEFPSRKQGDPPIKQSYVLDEFC